MDRQREIIYDQRNKVLDGADLSEQIKKMIDSSIEGTVKKYLPENENKDLWNIEGLKDYYIGWLLKDEDLNYTKDELKNINIKDIISKISEKAHESYNKKEKEFWPTILREIERVVLLRCVDNHWTDHIDAMEELKKGIRLRAYAQRDPVIEYRSEGFDMFDEMIDNIRDDTVKILLSFKMQGRASAPKREGFIDEEDKNVSKEPIVKENRIGRNDPCPCGSGKKYKKCCGMNE